MLTPEQISQIRTKAGLSPTPPPVPDQGANDIIAKRKAALNPQVDEGANKSAMPLLTKEDGGFGTAIKDVAVGAGKSFIRGGRDIANLAQEGGKKILGAAGADTSKLGIKSIDNNTPEGAQVADQLKSKSRGEQVGSVLENIGEVGAGFATTEGENVLKATKNGYDAFKEARGASLAEKEANDVLDLVKPKLTPTMEAEAKASGRSTTEGGILNRVKITPSDSEKEMAQYAHEAGVNTSNTASENIKLMKDAQTKSAEELRKGLQGAEGTWSKNDIKSSLRSIERPITVKSDKTLTKLADNFESAVLKIAETTKKDPEGILDLRQTVDSMISKEFPSNIYSKDTPVGQYVKNLRQSLNSLAESKLPEGKLPNGSTFRAELRRQHLLYDAIDNVAEKAPKEGESARPIIQKARDFGQKHPIITGGAATLGAEKILKKMGVPLP